MPSFYLTTLLALLATSALGFATAVPEPAQDDKLASHIQKFDPKFLQTFGHSYSAISPFPEGYLTSNPKRQSEDLSDDDKSAIFQALPGMLLRTVLTNGDFGNIKENIANSRPIQPWHKAIKRSRNYRSPQDKIERMKQIMAQRNGEEYDDGLTVEERIEQASQRVAGKYESLRKYFSKKTDSKGVKRRTLSPQEKIERMKKIMAQRKGEEFDDGLTPEERLQQASERIADRYESLRKPRVKKPKRSLSPSEKIERMKKIMAQRNGEEYDDGLTPEERIQQASERIADKYEALRRVKKPKKGKRSPLRIAYDPSLTEEQNQQRVKEMNEKWMGQQQGWRGQ